MNWWSIWSTCQYKVKGPRSATPSKRQYHWPPYQFHCFNYTEPSLCVGESTWQVVRSIRLTEAANTRSTRGIQETGGEEGERSDSIEWKCVCWSQLPYSGLVFQFSNEKNRAAEKSSQSSISQRHTYMENFTQASKDCYFSFMHHWKPVQQRLNS